MNRIYIIALIIFFASCKGSIITVPEFVPTESDRVVLIEEMTGVSCPNCPKGTAEIESLKALYGDKVIPIAIHGIFLSWPTAESKYDLRNEFSRLLEANFASGTSKPAALINRITPDGESDKVIDSPDLWGSHVESQLSFAPKLNIELELAYDNVSRKLEINAGFVALERINEALNISVMILENHIEDAQEDLTEIIEDFEHNHVLRTMLTEFDGDAFVNSLDEGAFESRSYTFDIPSEEDLWIAENIEVVLFIHQAEGEGEVLQAAVQKIIP